MAVMAGILLLILAVLFVVLPRLLVHPIAFLFVWIAMALSTEATNGMVI